MNYKKARKLLPPEVINLYTDILAHRYEPGGSRVACGTSTGLVTVIEESNQDDRNARIAKTFAPVDESILGLEWGPRGIFAGVAKGFYWYKFGSKIHLAGDPVFVESVADVMDLRCLSEKDQLAAACEDGKLRVYDLNTLKVVNTLGDSTKALEVLSVSPDFVAVGARDGTVTLYEAGLRTPEPVWRFVVDAKVTPSLAITSSSTWLATATHGSPTIYNMTLRTPIPKSLGDNPRNVFCMEFDTDNNLWWGGDEGILFGTDLDKSDLVQLPTEYGQENIHHIYSITTSVGGRLSVAGASNGVLVSGNSRYWDAFIRI